MKKQNLNAIPELSGWRMKHLGYQVELCQKEKILLDPARVVGAAQDAQRFCFQISYSHFLLLCPRSNLLVFWKAQTSQLFNRFFKYDLSKRHCWMGEHLPPGTTKSELKSYSAIYQVCDLGEVTFPLHTSVFPDIQWDDYLPHKTVRGWNDLFHESI